MAETTGTTANVPRRGRGLVREVGRVLFRNQLTTIGTILTVATLLIAAFAPLFATHDPLRTNVRNRLQPPSAEHWMGTDEAGRDIYSRAMFGARVSVRVGYAVVALTTVFGLIIGVAESLTRAYSSTYFPWVGSNFDIVVPYAIMILVLMIRPYGLFGTPEVQRV